MIDGKLEVKTNYFPITERLNLIQDSYFMCNHSNFVKKLLISKRNKFISMYGSISYFDEKKIYWRMFHLLNP